MFLFSRIDSVKYLFNVKTFQHLHLNKVVKSKVEMSTRDLILKPPCGVRGMQNLDKSLFEKEIIVPYFKFESKLLAKVGRCLKKYILKMERFRSIQPIADSGSNRQPIIDSETDLSTVDLDEYFRGPESIVILDPQKVTAYQDINKYDLHFLHVKGATLEHFGHRRLQLTFDNYSVEDIFRAILPPEQEGMASFTKVGHIVHVNLREHLLPYKTIIGQVLLDKVAQCESVVNKTNSIDNTYRNFQMEVLAGSNDFQVCLKENKCVFEFDFSTVYWNSRLCTEHERIVALIQKDDVVFDVFAGVGPFAVPAAKKGAQVWANDLNPASFNWLEHNAAKNKVVAQLTPSPMDGKDFIEQVIKRELLIALKRKRPVHIIMNLPAMAHEFLKFFEGLYTLDDFIGVENFKPPMIYLYCFAKGENSEEITLDLLNQSMPGRDLRKYVKNTFAVRTVSNFKEMMRVTIALERDILFGMGRVLPEGDTLKRKISQSDAMETDSDSSEDGEETKTKKKC